MVGYALDVNSGGQSKLNFSGEITMHESRLKHEKKTSHTIGFVEGLECTKDIITNELKDAIQNGTIIIEKGSDKLFDIINSVGKV